MTITQELLLASSQKRKNSFKFLQSNENYKV